jgi:predicted DNA-binding transcriptional regulator AlpA
MSINEKPKKTVDSISTAKELTSLNINEGQTLQQHHLKKMYRAKEVAELLGIGKSTVWLYAKQGKLTPIKLSANVTVFSIEDINKMLNSNGAA